MRFIHLVSEIKHILYSIEEGVNEYIEKKYKNPPIIIFFVSKTIRE